MTEETVQPPRAPNGSVFFLTDEDSKRVRRLIDIEPDISKIVRHKHAWQMVLEAARKAALWISGIGGGLYVLREFLRGMTG